MIVEGSCLSLDDGEPGRNAGPSAVPQAIVILIYIAEIPLDPWPRIDYPVQIHTITGTAPFRRKIHNHKGARINELE